jgi:hypothetical protein
VAEHDKYSDSAGVPWAGRSFQENSFAMDSGEADPDLLAALKGFHSSMSGQVEVAEKFALARVLIPLVANLGESGLGVHGQSVDKSAELSIVSVRTPDNQNALPVFTSVESMYRWNSKARPVPNNGRTVALGAVAEGNTRVVIDPGSETEFVLRRTALEAIAQGLDWKLPHLNPEVIHLVDGSLDRLSEVVNFTLLNGDPRARLLGHELEVVIYLTKNVDQVRLGEIQSHFLNSISTNTRFVVLVDSIGIKFLPAN